MTRNISFLRTHSPLLLRNLPSVLSILWLLILKSSQQRQSQCVLIPSIHQVRYVSFLNSFARSFTDDKIYIGAYYYPHLLPDYGGELFQHQQAQLIQRDVQDKDNHLIPPGNTMKSFDLAHLCSSMPPFTSTASRKRPRRARYVPMYTSSLPTTHSFRSISTSMQRASASSTFRTPQSKFLSNL